MGADKVILGAGITGLSAGIATGAPVYEAEKFAGGICMSYYKGSYRFEAGGGHWIFGADEKILAFIRKFIPLKSYERNSAVYFPGMDLYVPYPIQNHLSYLPADIREQAISEILNSKDERIDTLKGWLEASFGRTLCELFFFPFHELYTAGLYSTIAPQDTFKTPVNKELLIKGAKEKTPAVGYNATFVYPRDGLDALIKKMESGTRVNFGRKAEKILPDKKEIRFESGEKIKYDSLISTLPLHKLLRMAGIGMDTPNPFTSVLVVNIGARKGVKCPPHHWLYIPESKSGFHRVGFYSNVDPSFLPVSSRKSNDRVSIYIEKAYPGGKKPSAVEIKKTCSDIVKELTDWEFINEAEVVDPTWIETAYTWQYPGSGWRNEAVKALEEHGIHSIGRYGKWKFQGIAESLADGIAMGAALNG